LQKWKGLLRKKQHNADKVLNKHGQWRDYELTAGKHIPSKAKNIGGILR